MIAVIQRVTKGTVKINNKLYSQINKGYVVLIAICQNDTESEAEKLANKIVQLRIMDDKVGKMNRSIIDAGGEILVVSQFTLCADLSTGRRPSFIYAKERREAQKLYEKFVKKLEKNNIQVKKGKFGAYMQVEIFNDGPVTFILKSQKT